jgi:hypothetical protein
MLPSDFSPMDFVEPSRGALRQGRGYARTVARSINNP